MKISNSLPCYPGDPVVRVEPGLIMEKKGVNVLSLCMGTHSGTHIDVPLHHIDEGKSLNDISLEKFMGEAVFLGIPKKDNQAITADDLKDCNIRPGDIVIIRTGWERKKYQDDYFEGFPYFESGSADYLISKKVKCIGADIPSVDGPGTGGIFHKKILSAEIGIIEALIGLGPLSGKRMFFSALPLNIEDGDGSPVRAVAVEGMI